MNHDPHALLNHMPYLLARARRLARNEADARDLVQDTCVHALEALDRLETRPENLRGWLVVVMRNHWFNVVRHRRVRASARADLAHMGALDSVLCETRASYSQLARAWSTLSAQAQTIARQCMIDGDSHAQVSGRFGMTPGGVATSIHRTREHLRGAMFGAA